MPRAVRSLGEVALRVNDLGVMRDFYERIVGLELMREFPGIAFFRLSVGYGGHTTILACSIATRRSEPSERRSITSRSR